MLFLSHQIQQITYYPYYYHHHHYIIIIIIIIIIITPSYHHIIITSSHHQHIIITTADTTCTHTHLQQFEIGVYRWLHHSRCIEPAVEVINHGGDESGVGFVASLAA